jgi:hypothetical protein
MLKKLDNSQYADTHSSGQGHNHCDSNQNFIDVKKVDNFVDSYKHYLWGNGQDAKIDINKINDQDIEDIKKDILNLRSVSQVLDDANPGIYKIDDISTKRIDNDLVQRYFLFGAVSYNVNGNLTIENDDWMFDGNLTFMPDNYQFRNTQSRPPVDEFITDAFRKVNQVLSNFPTVNPKEYCLYFEGNIPIKLKGKIDI